MEREREKEKDIDSRIPLLLIIKKNVEGCIDTELPVDKIGSFP